MENPLITYVQRCSDGKYDAQDVCDILMGMDRLQAIDWLCWNDPNGLYRNIHLKSEGIDPLTEAGAKLLCMKQIWENQVVTLL